MVALAVVALLAVVAALFAGRQWQRAQAERNRANRQARLATSRQLAAQARSYSDDHLDRGLLLSLEANRITAAGDVRNSLVFGLESSPHLKTFLHGHWTRVSGLDFSPDGATLASASHDLTAKIWDVTARHRLREASPIPATWTSVAFSPDGKTLAVGDILGGVMFFDVALRGSPSLPVYRHNGRVSSLDFSPDGQTLASGSDDGTIVLWDVASRQPFGQPIKNHTAGVGFSADGKWLAYASDESGRREVYVRPFPNVADGRWQISTDGGRSPLWAHSGRELF
ncbi:MAG: WD40 repeat domain-containing protein, partial [Anaerolineae bacterium]